MPDIGLLPPDFIFAAVLAIAPVAGIPPNNPEVILAIPCATNSIFESCVSSIISSATTADNNDSNAPNIAIVIAGANSLFIVAILNEGNAGIGITLLPIVSTGKCKTCTKRVDTIRAIIDPGITLFTFGQSAIIIIQPIPIANEYIFNVFIFAK